MDLFLNVLIENFHREKHIFKIKYISLLYEIYRNLLDLYL